MVDPRCGDLRTLGMPMAIWVSTTPPVTTLPSPITGLLWGAMGRLGYDGVDELAPPSSSFYGPQPALCGSD